MGRLQPRLAWDHKIYTARKLGELPLRLQPKHPCPLTGWLALIHGHGTLITASLYGVCFGKGLTTYWTIPCPLQGQVVVPTKGSYWSRLGLQPTQVVQESTNHITTSEINHHSSSLTMLCRAYSSRRGIRDKLVSTQDHDFPGFLPVCKRSSRGRSKSSGYPLLATNNSKVHSCTRLYRYIKPTHIPSQKVLWSHQNTTTKYYARVQKCLPSRVCKGCTYWKLSFSSKNPILQNTQITNISNTVQKVVSNIFEITLIIN